MKILLFLVISLPSLFFLQTTVTAQTFSQGNRIVNAQCSIEVEREGRFKFPCHAEFDQDGSVKFDDLQMLIRCKGGKQSCAGFEEEVVREGHFGSIEVYGESVRLCWNRGFSRSAQGCIEGLKKVGNCAQRVVEPCFSQNTRDCAQSVYACVVPVPVSSLSLQDTFVESSPRGEMNGRQAKHAPSGKTSLQNEIKSKQSEHQQIVQTRIDWRDAGSSYICRGETKFDLSHLFLSNGYAFLSGLDKRFPEPPNAKSGDLRGWLPVRTTGATLAWSGKFEGHIREAEHEFNQSEMILYSKEHFYSDGWRFRLSSKSCKKFRAQ
jgi:hypothetical protein